MTRMLSGMPLVHLTETDSTNLFVKRCLKGEEGPCPDMPFAVYADCQTGGRGRLGRSFVSPGGGLYLSVLWPVSSSQVAMTMTPLAAVAVWRTLRDLGVESRIKWVNDVYMGEKKVCGILCEKVDEGIIVGIGVNIRTPEGGFPSDAGPAGAIDQAQVTREKVLEGILHHLQQAITCPDEALGDYRAASLLTGRRVVCQRGDSTVQGLVKGISEDYGLMIETEEGEQLTMHSGEVTRVRPVSQAAFFDFDGTMRHGDSVVPYVQYARKSGYMSLWQYVCTIFSSVGFVLKIVPAEKAKTVALRFHKNLSADVRQILDEGFARLILRDVYPEARQKWDELKNAGCKMVVLSASTYNYMQYVAQLLGADSLLCTRIEEDGTVRLNCHGREKVVRAEAYAAENGVDFAASWAFGDSGSDIFILTRVGHGYAVNPKKKLRKLAAEKGLEPLSWR